MFRVTRIGVVPSPNLPPLPVMVVLASLRHVPLKKNAGGRWPLQTLTNWVSSKSVEGITVTEDQVVDGEEWLCFLSWQRLDLISSSAKM